MFNESVILAAKADAKSKFPRESCGLVVNDEYLPCVNIAPDPRLDFMIAQEVTNPYVIARTLQGVIHSHPVKDMLGKSSPSKNDMIGQVSTSVPWGVIDTDGDTVCTPYWWGDFILDEPIIGREFHPGINDCYSIIRKWYWQKRGILLKEFPRDDAWWASNENMYVEGFAEAGFYAISKNELQDGDIILGKVLSSVINHGGIYLHNKEDGYGTILHHLPKRLSRRETANPWIEKAELFLRYKNVV
jgi:cell wall-associated NlpC family hydrolase